MLVNVIKDTLFDALKLVPFLFIAFLLMELFEHKKMDKFHKVLSKEGKYGPIVGGLLGAIPQCGFSVLVTNLYVFRIITLGTLISVYLSTSDEMLPILLSSRAPINSVLVIVISKILFGIIFGFIIDLIYKNKSNSNILDHHVCNSDNCDCEDSLIKSVIIHIFKTLLYIIIITFILNISFEVVGSKNISKLFLKNNPFAPFVSALVGLIPNCGSSIAITELYLNNVITIGTCIGGLLTGSGIGLLILFKNNKNIKENISIMILLYLIGSILGTIINLVGVSI